VNKPLLILRPLPAASSTERKARDLGYETLVNPLFRIDPMRWTAPPANEYDAIMLTSANAIRCGGDNLADYVALPALVVGKATADAARSAGFDIAAIGDRGAQSLTDKLVELEFQRILRLAARVHTEIETEVLVDTRIVYEAMPLNLGKKAQTAIKNGSIVLLHSTKAAEKLMESIEHLQIDQGKSHIVAISETVAKAAGKSWKSTSVADVPTDDALLSAASALCLQQ